jgi:ribosome assembly protein YihI (activator of Der GTPase)
MCVSERDQAKINTLYTCCEQVEEGRTTKRNEKSRGLKSTRREGHRAKVYDCVITYFLQHTCGTADRKT